MASSVSIPFSKNKGMTNPVFTVFTHAYQSESKHKKGKLTPCQQKEIVKSIQLQSDCEGTLLYS